jgi:hypothetical protein
MLISQKIKQLKTVWNGQKQTIPLWNIIRSIKNKKVYYTRQDHSSSLKQAMPFRVLHHKDEDIGIIKELKTSKTKQFIICIN